MFLSLSHTHRHDIFSSRGQTDLRIKNRGIGILIILYIYRYTFLCIPRGDKSGLIILI